MMIIIEIKEIKDLISNKSLNLIYLQFKKLLEELRNKALPNEIIESINQDIREINSSTETSKKMRKLLNQKHMKILALVKKELNLVPAGHYRTLWMALGMSIFGLPVGIIYGKIVGNMGLLTLGLPVGLSLGIMVGMVLDNKVKKEGRQLNIENLEPQIFKNKKNKIARSK